MTYAEQVGSLRRALHRALVRYLAERTERPVMQLLALRVVSRAEVQTQAQLAERLLVDAPAASRLVATLEEEGLVKRTTGEDRRCVCLSVTAAAKKEVAIIDEALRWLDGQVRENVSAKEYESSMAVLAKIQAGLVK
jgi:DNA-binding MarR family transcriptional regulator